MVKKIFNPASAWRNTDDLPSKAFVCWNCNEGVAPTIGYRPDNVNHKQRIYICHHCNSPNVYDSNGNAILLPLPGEAIDKLPENIKLVYSEIRSSMQSGCFNGAIMLMRKLIMHVAVEEGAEEGKKFIEYIDYLCDEGIVPRKSKSKADSVRILGNSVNHAIENRTQEEAQNCFEFIVLLLKVNYEFVDEEEAEEEVGGGE